MINEDAIAAVFNGLGLHAVEPSKRIKQLEEAVNQLLLADFNKLVSILYRMDISESKLKQLLHDRPSEDAAAIIAELMIERQAEKIKSRRQFSRSGDDIDENEKW